MSREAKQKAVEHGPGLVEQFSRSYLWRTHGFFQTLRGSSGSPIEVIGDSGKSAGPRPRMILGFQNFEWKGDSGFHWGHDDEAIIIHGEEYSAAAVMSTVYGFYGSYQLPDAITSSRIRKSASLQRGEWRGRRGWGGSSSRGGGSRSCGGCWGDMGVER